MKKIFLLLLLSCGSIAAGQLDQKVRGFIDSAKVGDLAAVTEFFYASVSREAWLDTLKPMFPMLQNGSFKMRPTGKELVLGRFAVVLIQLESGESKLQKFQEFYFELIDGKWTMHPCESPSDIEGISERATPDELIHLELMTDWVGLMTELLEIRDEK